MLKGKLTYITAIAAIGYGLVGLLLGFGDSQQNFESILLGTGLFGLRRAM